MNPWEAIRALWRDDLGAIWENYTRNEWRRCETTLETSWEDVKTTLETSGEDMKSHSNEWETRIKIGNVKIWQLNSYDILFSFFFLAEVLHSFPV